MTMRWRIGVAGSIVAILCLTGCATTIAPRRSASPTPSPESNCMQTVPATFASSIADGANDIPIEPTGRIAAVDRGGDVYIVAMEFTIEGDTDPETGIWMLSARGGEPGLIAAVDAVAAVVTVWPHTWKGVDLSIAMDGAQEAENCLNPVG